MIAPPISPEHKREVAAKDRSLAPSNLKQWLDSFRSLGRYKAPRPQRLLQRPPRFEVEQGVSRAKVLMVTKQPPRTPQASRAIVLDNRRGSAMELRVGPLEEVPVAEPRSKIELDLSMEIPTPIAMHLSALRKDESTSAATGDLRPPSPS